RLLSHADGQTVHQTALRLRWRPAETPRGRRVVDVRLKRLRNRVELPGRTFVLFHAPPGFAFLRRTQQGQYTLLRLKDGQEMVLVPTGLARRGAGEAPPNGPAHVMLTKAFLIDRTEVTNRQYGRFLGEIEVGDVRVFRHREDPGVDLTPATWSGNHPPPGTEELPVVGIAWYAAFAYAKWAGGRLPTEAEWERAGAGPDGLVHPWGDEFRAERCVFETAGPAPAASHLLGEGPFSLLHMSGNVREWCADRFDPRWLARAARIDPHGPPLGNHVVVRGGSFRTPKEALALQARGHAAPRSRALDLGFRVARSWGPGPASRRDR
ncbi:MAG: formylglycine-generating enzyme family protein, partial [Planctomycetota bacterium]